MMNRDEIIRAAAMLHQGKLVAFPTETVYGLGADATSAAAVERIFIAKGRPATNPLIVHAANAAAARHWAAVWPADAEMLAAALWPGPLTLVLPKSPAIVDAVTAGRATVGLRVPKHPLALELLAAFGGPIAAPSANRSNHISPTTAEHVRQELGERVSMVLDGGPCDVGIESTVLDLSGEGPRILRPGGVSAKQIEAILGRAVPIVKAAVDIAVPAASPGQHPIHYAPVTPAFHFVPPAAPPMDSAAGYLLLDCELAGSQIHVKRMPGNPEQYARQLYSTLRQLDRQELSAIYIELPPDEAGWFAVRDRLLRATRPQDKK